MKYIKHESYEAYAMQQTITNKAKLNNVWATKNELVQIANWIKTNNIPIELGICHGVRNGYEVKILKEILDTEIIGTEISDTATQFKNVIHWDFHDANPIWKNQVGFIYSNSWDHSYDFEKALEVWMECLIKDGACFLEWSPAHTESGMNKADCFGISKDELINLINKKYTVTDVFAVNGKHDRVIIVVKNKD